MFCTSCGSRVDDGMQFCPNCGSKMEIYTAAEVLNAEPVPVQSEDAAEAAQPQAQPPVYQAPVQAQPQVPVQPVQPQQGFAPNYGQPQQGYQQPQPLYQQNNMYAPPVYAQPVYQQPAPQSTPAPQPVKRTNGPGVAGLVFGILTLIMFVAAAFSFNRALEMAYSYYYSSPDLWLAYVAGAAYSIGCILFIFNLIFGIIGFARGLKTKIKLAAGIIGFVLIFINLFLLIWEAVAYVAFIVAVL